ncbi:hypothetical protein HYDPIDRAFT_177687 [Hydnomerulius pinastri MD-312]|uniref:Uncharacterized protein n=1 Tax=Hydnomerulius pinastri MD-312 TaxID=994086 RepID=A0A0C9V3C6_9AGAM|nr:hypothetical protein HYDPIDRAFT_177687 [Hydnomerulius pinastri MD-312]
MRFPISTIVILPALVSLVAGLTVPEPGLVARKGGNGGGGNGNGNGSSSSATATATTSAVATASATSSVANPTSTSSGGGNDPQSSLTLDPAVIAKGFENDGQDQPAAGQVASLTSSNNFINFCLTVPNQPITNGQQITGGSCNPAPMGSIPSSANMPSAKFTNPKNFDTIPANQAFTVSLAIQGMETGHFVNAEENYFSAPQQLNGQGQIQGHSHVVIEQLDSLTQTTPTDPTKFAFFKGLNDAAQNGILTADVTNGLPEGTYKISTINSAANHQPVLVPIAQHGSLDDVVYFTVSNNAGAGGAGNSTSTTSAVSGAGGSTTATASSTSAAATSTSTAGSGNGGGKGKGNRRFFSRMGMTLGLH